ncbi:MAG: ribonuclease III [bacterium]
MEDYDQSFVETLRNRYDVPIEGNEEWFLKAFTHRSYANEEQLNYDNERLEFLGDTVLDLIVAEYLLKEYPDEREGRLSKIKSAVVRTGTLSKIAKQIGLDKSIRLSKGEAQVKRGRSKVIADVLEAFIGALYTSTDLVTTRDFILPYITDEIERYLEQGNRNFKGQLLEFTQERGLPNPVYTLENVKGPEHDPEHCVTVEIKGTAYGSGTGSTKKDAEQDAAEEALESLRDEYGSQ